MIRQHIAPDGMNGPELSICGEMASDRYLALLLIGLGYRSFSVSIPSVPMIKYVIRKVEASKCRENVENLMRTATLDFDLSEIKRYLDYQMAYS
jgi:phosphoenolpyruvate-protein kinase (PTS system EI component)